MEHPYQRGLTAAQCSPMQLRLSVHHVAVLEVSDGPATFAHSSMHMKKWSTLNMSVR